MKLADVFGKDKVCELIDGIYYYKTSQKTKNGELFMDEENLFYKPNNSDESILISYEVGDWIYIDDDTIIYECLYDNHPYSNEMWIYNVKGEYVARGIITDSKHLLYKKGNQIIKSNASLDGAVVCTLPSEMTQILFGKNTFSILETGDENSCLWYEKIYDEDGVFLKEKTEKEFSKYVIKSVAFRLINLKKLSEYSKEEQFEAEQKINRIADNINKITFEEIENLITVFEKTPFINPLSVSGYRTIEKLFKSIKVTENLEHPFINVMDVNLSGFLGKSSMKFISCAIAKKLVKLCKIIGEEEFKQLLFTPLALNRAIKEKYGEIL